MDLDCGRCLRYAECDYTADWPSGLREPRPSYEEDQQDGGDNMTTTVAFLGLSVLASLLVVQLGPRPSGDGKLKQMFAGVARRPPAHFLRIRVALLVLSAALLVMAVGAQKG